MHIGHVIVGDQGRQPEIDFGTGLQWVFHVWFLAGFQCLHCSVQQLGIQRESDFLDLSALFVTQ